MSTSTGVATTNQGIPTPSSIYDRFNPSKRYKKLAFRSGVGLQGPELNEMQDTILYEVNRIAGVLYSEGSLLSGAEYKLANGVLAIKDGVMYALGFTHDVPAAAFPIDPSESCVVGVIITTTQVTDFDDVSLRDPSTNTRNYNQAGAYRVRYDAVWTKDTGLTTDQLQTFFPIHTVQAGEIISQVIEAPEFAGLQQQLAKYDSSANGSFVVEGFIATYVGNDTPNRQHLLSVSEGSAHVAGYIVEYQNARRVSVDWATDQRTIMNEPVIYTTDGWYQLRWNPIASVAAISAQKVVTRTVTRGTTPGGRDLLPDEPVIQINTVVQGGTTYVKGTDFIQYNDYIDWSPSGAEPATGSSFNITYVFQSSVVPQISDDLTRIYLAGLNPQSTVSVIYNFYMPRIDRLMLGQDGSLTLLKGVADALNPKPPVPTSGLQLATLTLAYGAAPQISTDYFRAFKNSDIQALASRVDGINYNLAQLVLRDAARGSLGGLTKKGFFTDPLTDNSQRDAGVTQNAMTVHGTIEAQVVSSDFLVRVGAAIQLPYVEALRDGQYGYSKSRLINEYAAIPAPPAVMSVTPANYTWTADGGTQNVQQTVVTAANVANVTWERHPSGDWSVFNQLTGYASLGSAFNNNYYQFSNSIQYGGTSTNTTTTVSSYLTGPLAGQIYYIPTVPVEIKAGRFSRGETVRVTFDSIQVGTSVADVNGNIDYTFNVPANTPSGAKEILTVGLTSGITGRGVFSAVPQVKVTVDTITKRVTQNILDITWVDPVAQTFTPTADFSLSSIELQFGNTTASWVDVIVVGTENGYPDEDTVYGHARIYDVGIVANVWTKFAFDNPVPLVANQEYALVVMTTDNGLYVHTAELGAWDIANGRYLTKQPYAAGVLFNSSNARAWTPIQTEDLMFRLNAAVYSTAAQPWTAVNTTTVTAATDIMLLADVVTQTGTVVEWQALLLDRLQVDNTPTPVVLTPQVGAYFSAYTGRIQLLYRLTSSNPAYSPTIGGAISLAVGYVQFPDIYVTDQFQLQGGTQISGQLIVYEPSGAQIVMYYEGATASLVVGGSALWTTVARNLSTDIGTYRYTGAALNGAAKPALVTIGGTVGTHRPSAAAGVLNAYDLFWGDVESIGSKHLYVQQPVTILADSFTLSGKGTGEYYYGNSANPSTLPTRMVIGNTELTQGTLGSLNPGQYAFGNNDSLQSNRVYVRLPAAEIINGKLSPRDSVYPASFVRMSYSPDTQAAGYITSSGWLAMTRTTTQTYGGDSTEAQWQSPSNLTITASRVRVEGSTTDTSRRPVGAGLRISYL